MHFFSKKLKIPPNNHTHLLEFFRAILNADLIHIITPYTFSKIIEKHSSHKHKFPSTLVPVRKHAHICFLYLRSHTRCRSTQCTDSCLVWSSHSMFQTKLPDSVLSPASTNVNKRTVSRRSRNERKINKQRMDSVFNHSRLLSA